MLGTGGGNGTVLIGLGGNLGGGGRLGPVERQRAVARERKWMVRFRFLGMLGLDSEVDSPGR